jgi:hypothetical protein
LGSKEAGTSSEDREKRRNSQTAGLWDLSGNNRYELWAFQTTHSSNLWPSEEGANMSDSIADLQRGFKEGVQTANEKSGCFSVAGMVIGVLLVIVLV